MDYDSKVRYVLDSLDKLSDAVHDVLPKEYSSCSGSTPKQQRVVLDLFMNKLDRAIMFPLRIHCNYLVPIHSLPDEILLAIFRYWWEERIMVCFGYETRMGKQLPLSWVCKHWRTLIKNNAEFWTYIDIDSTGCSDALQVALQRSKSAGLHMTVLAPPRLWRPEQLNRLVTRIIPKEAHRIETLRTHLISANLWSNILNDLKVATSRLRFFSMTCHGKSIELKSCPGISIDLKSVIIALESPTPWSAFNQNAFMSTIRELKFAETDVNTFDLNLNQCSRLQVLDLLWTRRWDARPFENLNFTTLEQLHTLVLDSWSSSIFLDYVQLPRLRRLVCVLRLSVQNEFERIKNIFTFSRIRRLGVGSQHHKCPYLQIDGTSEDSNVALTCCGTDFAYHDTLSPEHQSNSHFQFCFKFENNGASTFDELLNSVIFVNILVEAANADKIIIRNDPDFDCSFEGLFTKFTRRQCSSLVIQNIEARDTINALKKLRDNNFCYGLEELALSTITLSMSRAINKEILKLAKARQQRGSPIKRIHMMFCTESQKDTLKGLSKKVLTGLTKLGVELVEDIKTIDDSEEPQDRESTLYQVGEKSYRSWCTCPCFGCLRLKSHQKIARRW